MGFFDSALAPTTALEPLTAERLRAALTRLEVNFEEDDDHLIAHFEHGYFFFLPLGEGQLLTVRGTWRGSLPADAMPAASAFAENWNREMVFPKTYPAVFGEAGDEFTVLICETNYPTACGLTDDQLDELLGAAISSGLTFFDALAENLGAA